MTRPEEGGSTQPASAFTAEPGRPLVGIYDGRSGVGPGEGDEFYGQISLLQTLVAAAAKNYATHPASEGA